MPNNAIKVFMANGLRARQTTCPCGVPSCVVTVTKPNSGAILFFNASAPAYSLRVALFWWIPGMILVAGYTTYIYRKFGGKVQLEAEGY